MLNVIHATNPFETVERDADRWQDDNGLSVRLVLERRYTGFTEFQFPTLCQVNGQDWMRARWDEVLPEDALVTFTRLPGWVLAGIAVGALLVGSVKEKSSKIKTPKTKKPKKIKTPSSHHVGAIGGASLHSADSRAAQNGDPVYSLTGQRNQVKPNNVLECAYGRNRIYPAYAAIPYNVYAGNNQYQYSLFCLGHGQFDVESMMFEDTPIANFPDIEYEIVDPGETFTLFHDVVETSAEVSDIELFGSNQPEYVGWTTPFVTNPPFTTVNRIEVDLSLPAGLYAQHPETGALVALLVEAQFQYQQLNDFGATVGDWQTMRFSFVTIVPNSDPIPPRKTEYEITLRDKFSVYLATATPQRYTLSAVVPAGRYQVRGLRTNPVQRTLSAQDVLKWETLRSFQPDLRNYGEITLIAMKARASNNLNNNAAAKFNLIGTRRLPAWSPTGGWSAPAATRSVIWAFCDIFKSRYGGRFEDVFLDLVDLHAFNTELQAESCYFDYIFDAKTTVWEAARAVARVARAVPIVQGSRITIVRDTPQEFARAVFNHHNIIRDSFSWTIRKDAKQSYDGVEVEYIDAETWKLETILCLIGDDLGDYPEPLRLTGCTDRQRAYQEGLYHRAVAKYGNESIEFSTGIEGNLPRYGDLIMVSHDLPQWGSGGFVKSIAEDLRTVQLSDPVTFTEGEVHRLILRNKDGSAYGPVTVTAGADEYHVISNEDILADFYFDEDHEPPLYLFGIQDLETRKILVSDIRPETRDNVEIEGVIYDERVYGFSGVIAPPRGAAPVRVTEPALPVVALLSVSPVPGTNEFINISWTPAAGAKNYVLETSLDGSSWQRVVTQPSTLYKLRVEPGYIYLRVAGVNVDIGPWSAWSGNVGSAMSKPGTVTGLHISVLTPNNMELAWNALAGADQYEVSYYYTSTGALVRRRLVTAPTFRYSYLDSVADDLTSLILTFRVKGVNLAGISETPASVVATLTQYNDDVPRTDADVTTFTADSTEVQADNV